MTSVFRRARLSSQFCLIISGRPSISRCPCALRNMPPLLARMNSRRRPLERVADQRLVRAEPVQRRGVDVRVAEVERLQQDCGRRLLVGRRAVGVRQAHAAQARGRRRRRGQVCASA